jgi:Ribbon-helix-helix protein, copG family
MAVVRKKTRIEPDAEVGRLTTEDIMNAELVVGVHAPSTPISVRLSPTLLERLDRLAAAEHRTRGNLIQHVLWEHVLKGKA